MTARFFHSQFMECIAREYFDPYAFVLNEQVYLTHDKNVMDFSTEWHTDPSRSLRFFLYLTDTTRVNGVFMYAPGRTERASTGSSTIPAVASRISRPGYRRTRCL